MKAGKIYLLVSSLIVIFSMFAACSSSVPEKKPLQQVETRNDLVLIAPYDNAGTYSVFFEGRETVLVRDTYLKIAFDAKIDKPKVILQPNEKFTVRYDEVVIATVYFRDKDQMRSYWFVRGAR